MNELKAKQNTKLKTNILIILVSAICVTLFCKSSPIYPIGDLPDMNTWLIQAKQMWLGQVPYKDIYEHKGPLQIMAYLFAALPCFKAFGGLYLTEIVLYSIYGFGAYKCSQLVGEKHHLLSTAIALLITSLSTAFTNTGTSEELLLPVFIWSLYFMVDGIKSGKEFKPLHIALIGAFCAIRLWTKYNLCFFDFILIGYTIYWYSKNKFNIWKAIKYYIIGFFCVTGPLLLYFAISGGLYDLFYVYFYVIMFKYSGITSENDLLSLIMKLQYTFPVLSVLLIAYPKKESKTTEGKFLLTTFALFFVSLFFVSPAWPYYQLDSFAFLVIFVTYILNSKKKLSIILLSFIIATLPILNDCNLEMLQYKKENYGQYKFAEVINQKEDPLVYYYHSPNAGFYTYSNTLPFARYFTSYNLVTPEIREEREEILESKKADFIITPKEYDIEGYEIICEDQVPCWDTWSGQGKIQYAYTFYLYEKTGE